MKSDESDLLEVVRVIVIDGYAQCAANVSFKRDLKTIRSRVKDEGLSFLTITLPNFARDLEQALAVGRILPEHFRMFRKYRAIPVFLQGMLARIFDLETGRLYDEFNSATDTPTFIGAIRQICLAFKKVEIGCTPAREAAAVVNFANIESSFSDFGLPTEDLAHFELVSSVLWGNMLHKLSCSMFTPRHGPGATADRISGNQKYIWRRWHSRLEPYFHLDEAGVITSDVERELERVTIVPPEQEQPVRVTLVPKTLKGPRIIAIEPHCMQYAQQGIRDVLYDVIESDSRLSGKLNFTDQSINQSLAMSGSSDGQLATVDLSDASDRVPLSLAKIMFNSNPDLWDAINACRSTHAELPDGTVLGPLKKFASMGSALCFPIEAMYFYTICVMALLGEQDLPVNHKNVDLVSSLVHVYGDDIIIPSTSAATVLAYLQKYNCKINHNKTFYSGKFRESCGVDAYDGFEVTPTYLRYLPPKNRQQASHIISWCETANQFYLKGYWHTAQYMYNRIEQVIGVLPYVSPDSEALGRVSYMGFRTVQRWNSTLHRFEVKAWCPTPVYYTDELDDHAALWKSLSKLVSLSSLDEPRDRLHLKRSARHGVVAIKRRWVPIT